MGNFLKKAAIFMGVVLYSVLLIVAGISYERRINEPTVAAENVNNTDEGYVVKLYNGGIWVFSGDEPVKRLNIDYNSLRLYDKELFTKGINVGNLRELTELEEDFSS